VQNRNFLVAGHTDNVPVTRRMTARRHYDSNWSLSALRGVAVVRFLASNGVPADRLAAAGYAETRPVASNDTTQGQAQNRRIEIIVMPNMDELPDLSGLGDELGQQEGGGSS
jgi:chemotaxis protein MotB